MIESIHSCLAVSQHADQKSVGECIFTVLCSLYSETRHLRNHSKYSVEKHM